MIDGRLTGTPEALDDLADPQIDPRITSLVHALLGYGGLNIRSVKTGHPLGPASPAGRVNDHWFYRAIDIDAVSGRSVSDRPIPSRVVDLGTHLLAMPLGERPDLVMGPGEWHRSLGGGSLTGFRDEPLANERHHDHLHLGYLASHPKRAGEP